MSRVSAALKRALSSRAIEIPLRGSLPDGQRPSPPAEVPRERVQRWTVEQIGDVPQFRDKTFEAVTLVPREQQLTAEQIGDVLQIREETVEKVKTALEERISEWSEAIKVPKISRQGSVTESKLTESSGEFSEVAKSQGDARPLGVAKYRAAAVDPAGARCVGHAVLKPHARKVSTQSR